MGKEVKFLVLYDVEKAQISIDLLRSELEGNGFSVEVDAIKGDARKFGGFLKSLGNDRNTFLIVHLTPGLLEDRDVANKFNMAVSNNIKYAVLLETEKKCGAIYLKGDQNAIDIDLLTKNAVPKVRNLVNDIEFIPFEHDKASVRFTVRKLTKMFCIGERFSMGDEALGHKYDMNMLNSNEAVKSAFESLNSCPPDKLINVLSFETKHAESYFVSKFCNDFKDNVILHQFEELNKESISVYNCIENLSSQLFYLVPEFQKPYISFENSVGKVFNSMISNPVTKIKSRKSVVFCVLEGLQEADPIQLEALIYSIQKFSPPVWLKIIMCCHYSVLERFKLNSISSFNVNEIVEIKEDKEKFHHEVIENLKQTRNSDVYAVLLNVRIPMPITVICDLIKVDLNDLIIDQKLVEKTKDNRLSLKTLEVRDIIQKAVKPDNIRTILESLEHICVQNLVLPDAIGSWFQSEVLSLLCKTANYKKLVELLSNVNFLLDRVKRDPYAFLNDLHFVEDSGMLLYKDVPPSLSEHLRKLIVLLKSSMPMLDKDYRALIGQVIARNVFDENTLLSNLDTERFSLADITLYLPVTPSLGSSDSSTTLSDIRYSQKFIPRVFSELTAVVALENDKYAIAKANGEVHICSGTDVLKVFEFACKITTLKNVPTSNILLIGTNNGNCLVVDLLTGSMLQDIILFSEKTKFVEVPVSKINSIVVASAHQLVLLNNESATSQNSSHYVEALTKESDFVITALEKVYFPEFLCAIAYENGEIEVFNAENTHTKRLFAGDGHSRPVISMACLESEQNLLFSGGFDRKICVWDLKTEQLLSQVEVLEGMVSSLHALLTPAIGLVVVFTSCETANCTAFSFSTKKNTPLTLLDTIPFANANITHSVIQTRSESGLFYLLASCKDATVIKKPLKLSYKVLADAEQMTHKDWITTIALHNSVAATGSLNGELIIHDLLGGKLLTSKVLKPEGFNGNLMVFSLDGKFLLSRVGVWQLTFLQNGEVNDVTKVGYSEVPLSNRRPVTDLGEDIELGNGKEYVWFNGAGGEHEKLKYVTINKETRIVYCEGTNVHILRPVCLH